MDERGLAGAGHHRAPVLELAVVAEDDVEYRLGDSGRKPVDALDLTPHGEIAERDLPSSLPASVSSIAPPASE